MPKKEPSAEPAPHSWDLEHWPQHVYPHTVGRARYLVRAHRDELIKAGALSRVGRELVVMGSRYATWLERRAAHVAEYVIAPNRAPAEAAA